MSSWQKWRRALGGSDPRHWRVPGFLAMRLRNDHGKRAWWATGVGLCGGGVFAAILLALSPPDELGKAWLLSIAMVAAFWALAFMYQDAVEIIISLEDEGLRRQIKPMLMNPFGRRDRNEFWRYDAIRDCGVVTAEHLAGKYSVLVIVLKAQALAFIIPIKIDVQQVAEFLASQRLRVKTLKRIPPHAMPAPSVTPRGTRTAAILASVGVALFAVGGLARLVIYSEAPKRDRAAVAKAVENAPLGRVLRECLAPQEQGVTQAAISPDGKWIWALTKTKRQLVWNDQQTEPQDALQMPTTDKCRALFSADRQRLVLVAGNRCHVWSLSPLQQEQEWELQETPDHAALSADGARLIVATMSAVRRYELATGMAEPAIPITIGAIVDTTLTDDDQSLIIAQHPRIQQVHLESGAVEELIKYAAPHPAHLLGTLSAGGKWAAMQAKQGTVLYDLAARSQGEDARRWTDVRRAGDQPRGNPTGLGNAQGRGGLGHCHGTHCDSL